MTALHLTWFAASLAVAAAVPGPAVMATIGRVLAHGERGALAFYANIMLGDLVWLWTATLGLGAAADALGPLLRWGELLGAGYLLVLAYRMSTTEHVAPREGPAARDGRAVLSGLMLQLSNPKTVLFYAALVPAIVPLETLTIAHIFVLSLVVALVVLVVNGTYVRCAVLARRYVRSPRALRTIYRINGGVLAVSAVVAAVAAIGGAR